MFVIWCFSEVWMFVTTFENFSDVDSSPQGNVNSLEEPEFTIDVADFECALCMR